MNNIEFMFEETWDTEYKVIFVFLFLDFTLTELLLVFIISWYQTF